MISSVETRLFATLLYVAPTVIAFGLLAGLPIVLLSGPLFPAAATTEVTRTIGEFDWTETEQGLLLSAFFHGYLSTLLLGGVLLSRFNGKCIFGIGILISSILTMLTPVAAKLHLFLVYGVRFLMGCAQGASFPAVQTVLGKWAPTNEKSTMGSITYAGMETGSISTFALGGIISSSLGWSFVFHVFGGVGFLFSVIWMIYVSESPESDRSISNEEREYILHSQQGTVTTFSRTKKPPVPWLQIYTSLPVWAISVSAFSHNWVYYLAVTDVPSYFSNVLGMEISRDGFVSSLPFFAASFMQVLSGLLADHLIKRRFSVTITRRIMAAVGFYPTGLFLYLITLTQCDQTYLPIVYIILVVGLSNFSYSSYGVNRLDLSPRFTGIVWSISTFFAAISGSVAPAVTGYIINNHPTRKYYSIVFVIAGVICVVGTTFYCFFASGQEQEWNNVAEEGYSGIPYDVLEEDNMDE